MRLVIDTNIAQSAGSSDVPVSFYSRECLNAVREHEHVAVFTRQLLDEWGDHASLFSRRWWKSMAARRRIENVEGAEFVIHLDPACACLAEDKWKEDFRKDFHLVKAALAADQTILSNEMYFPGYLSIAARTVRVLSALYYASPAAEGEPCIEWVRAGAKPEGTRRIEVLVKEPQLKAH
jgi:hypothetical protein